MYIRSDGLDGIQYKVLKRLVGSKIKATPTRGPTRELLSVTLKIAEPRKRLSRTTRRGLLFSCLGEFLWYWAGKDDLETIGYYIPLYKNESPDGVKIHGAYGPRLWRWHGHNQIGNVVNILTLRPDSRRAVIQLFDARDLAEAHKEVPCTCTLQFQIRDNRLHLTTYMRSNDVIKGLPHDVFSFTLIQEIVARRLKCDLGTYVHMVGNLHLYEADMTLAQKVLDEGQPPTMVSMPAMPMGDPWPSLDQVVLAEDAIRRGLAYTIPTGLDTYWTDLINLLKVFHYYKQKDIDSIEAIKDTVSQQYRFYIDRKQRDLSRHKRQVMKSEQLHLDL